MADYLLETETERALHESISKLPGSVKNYVTSGVGNIDGVCMLVIFGLHKCPVIPIANNNFTLLTTPYALPRTIEDLTAGTPLELALKVVNPTL